MNYSLHLLGPYNDEFLHGVHELHAFDPRPVYTSLITGAAVFVFVGIRRLPGQNVAFSLFGKLQGLIPAIGYDDPDFLAYPVGKNLVKTRVDADMLATFIDIVVRHPVRVGAHSDNSNTAQEINLVRIER